MDVSLLGTGGKVSAVRSAVGRRAALEVLAVVASFYNPYAAVPSMHIGFALLVGITVWRLARRRVVRAAALAYPVFVLFVIVATGNHFLDAVAGAAVAVVAGVLSGLPACRRRREPAEIRPLPLTSVSEIWQRRAA